MQSRPEPPSDGPEIKPRESLMAILNSTQQLHVNPSRTDFIRNPLT